MPRGDVQRHGAALRKAGDRDARSSRRRARSRLDQRADRLRGGVDAVEVFGGTPVDADDVVPGAHLVTVVDGHRPHRRMREHESQHGHAVVEQFGHQRLEVVAVGAEAVHPDDGEGGIGSGFDGDGFKCLQTQLLQTNGLRDVDTVRFAAHMSWSTSSENPGRSYTRARRTAAVNPIHMRPCSAPQPG